jgi:gliding motility-associated-like protein
MVSSNTQFQNPYMRNFILILFFAAFTISVNAQNCLEVETILVNACDDAFGSPEGLNEMFRFRVGANSINIADIQIVNGWPSEGVNTLPFNGFVQNAQTEAKTAELNATITESCGYLIEPPNGIIPAGKRVLAITSYEVSTALNSFANLTDTLFVIYHQHTGEAGGHFLNYNVGTPQEQTLRIQVNGDFPCYEEVTYIRGNLVDANGNNADQNGAFVDFTSDGIPSYGNTSCQAPFEPFSADWTNPGVICENADSIDLSDYVVGTLGGTFSGAGVNGIYFNPAGLQDSVEITYTVIPTNDCNTIPASITHSVFVVSAPDANFTLPDTLCGSLGIVELTGSVNGTPGGTFAGNGVSNSILNLSGINGTTNITYSVGSSSCFDTESQSVFIINLSTPVAIGETVFCNGEEPTAINSAADAGAVTNWYSDSDLQNLVFSGSDFIPATDITTSYFVVQETGNCRSDSVEVAVEFNSSNMPEGDTLLEYCVPENLPLAEVSGSGTINWYTSSALTNSIESGTSYQSTNSTETLYVTATQGQCESNPLVITFTQLQVSAAFSTNIDSGYVSLEIQVSDESVNAETCIWSIDDSLIQFSGTGILTFDMPGLYTLQAICSTAEGCADTVSREIKVKNDSLDIFIPNVFTPGNGDAFNELFQVKHNAVKTFTAQVFNRWGKLLFTWNDPDKGWDGTSNGERVTDGTYFYSITGTDIKEQPFTKNGSITLLGN